MRIAILGGTGDIGEGLALRWARDTDHEIVVGSRDPEKAERKVAEYEETLTDRGVDAALSGTGNPSAAAEGEVVVLAVPPYYVADTVEAVADGVDADDVLVSPAAGMQRDEDGMHYHRPDAGSVTQLAARAAPEGVPVVGAFHNLAAGRLANLDAELGIDTLVVADDQEATELVAELAESIEGLRALDAGGLANAAEVESVTPLLVNVAMHNDGLHDLGVRFK